MKEVKIHIFERLDEFQRNSWEKCDFMILKVTTKQSFTLSSESMIFEIYSQG